MTQSTEWHLMKDQSSKSFAEIPIATPLFVVIENDPTQEWGADEDLIPGFCRAVLVKNPLNAPHEYSWYVGEDDDDDEEFEQHVLPHEFAVAAWRREFADSGDDIPLTMCPVCAHDCYGETPKRVCRECGWCEWLSPKQNKIVSLMMQLTDSQREDVICEFCRHCGSTDPACQCWNDE